MEQHYANTLPSCLSAITKDLREVDRQLGALVDSIPVGDSPLPGELLGGLAVVRTDLLGDAIATLEGLGQLDEATATRQYLESVDRLERAGHRITAERPALNRPEAIVDYLISRHTCLDQEILGAVYVDVHTRLIADVEIFRGTLNRLAVETRVILRQALERRAAGFLLWHTHPSGDPRPTPEDVDFTRELATSAQLLGIELIDHLILGAPGRWVSLKRHGGWKQDRVIPERGMGDE